MRFKNFITILNEEEKTPETNKQLVSQFPVNKLGNNEENSKLIPFALKNIITRKDDLIQINFKNGKVVTIPKMVYELLKPFLLQFSDKLTVPSKFFYDIEPLLEPKIVTQIQPFFIKMKHRIDESNILYENEEAYSLEKTNHPKDDSHKIYSKSSGKYKDVKSSAYKVMHNGNHIATLTSYKGSIKKPHSKGISEYTDKIMYNIEPHDAGNFSDYAKKIFKHGALDHKDAIKIIKTWHEPKVNESEELNELSKNTLRSYSQKSNDYISKNMGYVHHTENGSYIISDKNKKKVDNRYKGKTVAVSKLYGYPSTKVKATNESIHTKNNLDIIKKIKDQSVTITLQDGTNIPINPHDAKLLIKYYESLDSDSIKAKKFVEQLNKSRGSFLTAYYNAIEKDQ